MIRGHGPWCDPECFGCHVASVSVQASKATPNRFGANGVAPRTPDPAWERGIAGEHRPDGSFVPYVNLDDNLEPIRVKQMAENRHRFTEQLRRLKSDPDVFRRKPGTEPQGANA